MRTVSPPPGASLALTLAVLLTACPEPTPGPDAGADGPGDAADAAPDAPDDRGSAPDAGEAGEDPLSDDDVPLLSVGGSRLKTYRLESEAASVGSGWFDTRLGQRCNFGRDTQGQLRCYPSDRAIVTSVLYSDPACTAQVVVLPRTACAPPTFLLREFGDVCPLGNRLFRRGADLPPAAPLFTTAADGACVPAPAPAADRTAFAVGQEIPADDLVLAHLRRVPSAFRLAAVLMETDDGARSAFSLHDTAGGFDCGLAPATDGALRCLPLSPVTVASSFTDAACSQPAGAGGSPACGEIAHARRAIAAACPARTAVFAGGPRAGELFARSAAGCRPTTGVGYTLGAELPPGTFAAGAPGLHPGPGRLRMRLARSSVGAQRTGQMVDTQLQVDCAAQVAADGTTRCLPTDTADASNHFADAACSVRLGRRAAGACAATHAVVLQNAMCPVRRQILRLDAPHAGPVFEGTPEGGCRAAAGDASYFAVGPEIPPSEFVELKVELR
jgi:hypothetical protein